MRWTYSNTLALADERCSFCEGIGMRVIYRGHGRTPCTCVFRAIFRACLAEYRERVVEGTGQASTVSWEYVPTANNVCRAYSRKGEEYIADFCLIARRTLDDQEYRLFRLRFLLNADWQLIARQLHIDRGAFFHATYAIEKKLGRAYAELEPYGLYPLDAYFGGEIRTRRIEEAIEAAEALPFEKVPRRGDGDRKQ